MSNKYVPEKVTETKCYLWHMEGNFQTLIAITADLEKAHFLATAANKYNDEDESVYFDYEKGEVKETKFLPTEVQRIDFIMTNKKLAEKIFDQKSIIEGYEITKASLLQQIAVRDKELEERKLVIQRLTDQRTEYLNKEEQVGNLEPTTSCLDNYEGFREELKHSKKFFKEIQKAISVAIWDATQYAIPNKDFCETLAGHMLHLLIWEKMNTNPNFVMKEKLEKICEMIDSNFDISPNVIRTVAKEGLNSEPVPLSVAQVIKVVKMAMKADKGYFETWKANIAVAFQDAAFAEVSADPEIRDRIHKISNQAAESFLNRFINN
jgi:hypothetical protein